MKNDVEREKTRGANPEDYEPLLMDWRGFEPRASSMPRRRSSTDLPAQIA